MSAWVDRAPDKASYRRRLAIWLIVSERLHVPDVARMLQVSTPAVWKWIQQYNATGPTSLDGPGRGGRHRAYLTPAQEAALLRRCERRAARGEVLTAAHLLDVVQEALGHGVSLSYVRRLLARHDWRRVMPRPRHAQADLAAQVTFPKGSRGGFAASSTSSPPARARGCCFRTRGASGASATSVAVGRRRAFGRRSHISACASTSPRSSR